ncbi:MAG: 7-carboxy-7-deazaguanine synthase QueE [Pseudomonadota bacterium]
MELKLARNSEGGPEIFRSLQGEGPKAGRVRTFVRLSGCNLHCVWCDTAYTWNWKGSAFAHERAEKFDPRREMVKLSAEEAAARIAELQSEALVITGGEPLLQEDALLALLDALEAKYVDMPVEFETNGTIAPSPALAERSSLFVVSPKLAHSGNAAGLALKDEALRAFVGLPAVFKFVARDVSDVAQIAAIAELFDIAPERVYVMPEGTDSATLRERGRGLAAAILQHDFNFSDRLHIHLFGAARGV